MRPTIFAALVLFLIDISPVHARVIRVPADYPKIQTAINASGNADTVVVYPGTYYENVVFRGKKILLTSRYYEAGDVNLISTTVINGSAPANPDTSSCVLIINGEDSTAVLQGFTLKGGKGTAWRDEHSSGMYREGGGVLVALSSPTIRDNLIVDNEAVDATNIASAGGGGLRCGDGSPRILHNVIIANKGMYGGGIVLNYCDGAVIKNNVIFLNRVDNFMPNRPTYGGGGIWVNNKLSASARPHLIENNTIYRNFSLDSSEQVAGAGAAILLWAGATAIVRNNIVWDNRSRSTLGALAVVGATASITYNDVMAPTPGTGNINTDPSFADSSLYLAGNSPCIDAGDTAAAYNDNENSAHPGTAKFPSQGGVRNDIGAYGGRGASLFPEFDRPFLYIPKSEATFGHVPPTGELKTVSVRYWNYGTRVLSVDSSRIAGNVLNGVSIDPAGPRQIKANSADSIRITWASSQPATMADTLLLYHRDSSQKSPARIPVSGKSFVLVPAKEGVMYTFSGAADSGKMYTLDTAKGAAVFRGSTGYPAIASARINPATKELVALTATSTPQLIRVSSEDALNDLIAPVSLSNPKGMAFRSDGTLIVGVLSGEIYSVDMNSGAAAKIVSTGLRIAGLAFDPLDGRLWASVRTPFTGKDNIYTIDLSTGTPTLIGATGFGVGTKDITFDSRGQMFGVLDSGSAKQSYLISINTLTGVGTLIGGTGVSAIEAVELVSYYLSSVQGIGIGPPDDFRLEQNYPNPFNPTTRIRFAIPDSRFVSLKVFDTLGREVSTLVNEQEPAGSYEVRFDGSSFASGVYLCRLQAGGFVEARKMILAK